MTDPAIVRNRWLAMVMTRIVAAASALLGVILLARANDWPTKVLGVAIVLVALYVMAVVPLALARRWSTRGE